MAKRLQESREKLNAALDMVCIPSLVFLHFFFFLSLDFFLWWKPFSLPHIPSFLLAYAPTILRDLPNARQPRISARDAKQLCCLLNALVSSQHRPELCTRRPTPRVTTWRSRSRCLATKRRAEEEERQLRSWLRKVLRSARLLVLERICCWMSRGFGGRCMRDAMADSMTSSVSMRSRCAMSDTEKRARSAPWVYALSDTENTRGLDAGVVCAVRRSRLMHWLFNVFDTEARSSYRRTDPTRNVWR